MPLESGCLFRMRSRGCVIGGGAGVLAVDGARVVFAFNVRQCAENLPIRTATKSVR